MDNIPMEILNVLRFRHLCKYRLRTIPLSFMLYYLFGKTSQKNNSREMKVRKYGDIIALLGANIFGYFTAFIK